MRTPFPLLLLGALAGCGLSATQARNRELCYAKAESAAQSRIDRECPSSLFDCPAANGIITELRLAQEACP